MRNRALKACAYKLLMNVVGSIKLSDQTVVLELFCFCSNKLESKSEPPLDRQMLQISFSCCEIKIGFWQAGRNQRASPVTETDRINH